MLEWWGGGRGWEGRERAMEEGGNKEGEEGVGISQWLLKLST